MIIRMIKLILGNINCLKARTIPAIQRQIWFPFDRNSKPASSERACAREELGQTNKQSAVPLTNSIPEQVSREFIVTVRDGSMDS